MLLSGGAWDEVEGVKSFVGQLGMALYLFCSTVGFYKVFSKGMTRGR